MKNILIIGVKSGLGEALIKAYLDNGDTVYSSAKTLKEGHIQTPKVAAQNLLNTFPKFLNYESGSFLDVRTMG